MMLKVLVCNFIKSNTPPWEIFRFFKLYKWYQIAQSITHDYLVFITKEDIFKIILEDKMFNDTHSGKAR